MDKKYHYFYKITNNINQHFYYGVHNTDNLNDGYMGSGSRLKYAIKKYGKNSFTKEILKYFDTEKAAFEYESTVVDEKMILNPDCYNIVLGGQKFTPSGMIIVENNQGQCLLIHKSDPRYLNGELKSNICGKTIVKDKQGNNIWISVNDFDREKYQGITKGYVIVKDNNGAIFTVKQDDPRYLQGELQSINKGYVVVKNENNDYIRVSVDDKDYVSGKYKYMFKDTVQLRNKITNKCKRVHKELVNEYLNNGYIYCLTGRVTVKDSDGNTMSVSKDDPRYLSGELIPVSKGIKLNITDNILRGRQKYKEKVKNYVRITNGIENKFVSKDNVQSYIDLGYYEGVTRKQRDKKIYIHKDDICKLIFPEELETYTSIGWQKGMGKRGKQNKVYINNGIKNKFVKESDINDYLNNGWVIGRLTKDQSNFVHINNGIKNKFIDRQYLNEYMNNGWVLGMKKRKQYVNN